MHAKAAPLRPKRRSADVRLISLQNNELVWGRRLDLEGCGTGTDLPSLSESKRAIMAARSLSGFLGPPDSREILLTSSRSMKPLLATAKTPYARQ